MTERELEERIRVLEAHITRLDQCIVALAALANSPLGSLSCSYHIALDKDGHPVSKEWPTP
jgi:hypothetical protein